MNLSSVASALLLAAIVFALIEAPVFAIILATLGVAWEVFLFFKVARTDE